MVMVMMASPAYAYPAVTVRAGAVAAGRLLKVEACPCAELIGFATLLLAVGILQPCVYTCGFWLGGLSAGRYNMCRSC